MMAAHKLSAAGLSSTADRDRVYIEGYAAIFGTVDLAGDLIRPGAFMASEKSKKLILTSHRRVMMLYQHAAENPIGVWTYMREDEHGLFVKGYISTGTRVGRDVYALIHEGVLDGLSIGFKVERSRRRPNGGRELLRLSLWEVSIVTFPMAPAARITRHFPPGQREPQRLF